MNIENNKLYNYEQINELKKENIVLKEKLNFYKKYTNPFSARLRMLRTIRHVKQSELANALKVNRCTVVKWEKGTAEPKISMLIPLAKYLSVDINYLIGDERNE